MKIQNYLKRHDFESVYKELDSNGFEYSLESIVQTFPKTDAVLIYAFLMYSISKEETVEKHIVICECLRYIEPYIFEATNLIYWHIMRAIELKERKIKAMMWALENYCADPCSPFSDEELCFFAHSISMEESENSIAHEFLNDR